MKRVIKASDRTDRNRWTFDVLFSDGNHMIFEGSDVLDIIQYILKTYDYDVTDIYKIENREV